MMLIIWFEEKILYYSQHITRLFEWMILMIIFLNRINGSRYSGMARLKFVEDSLWKTICGRQFLQSCGIPNSLLITYLNYTIFGSRYSRMAQVKFVVCHITSNFLNDIFHKVYLVHSRIPCYCKLHLATSYSWNKLEESS